MTNTRSWEWRRTASRNTTFRHPRHHRDRLQVQHGLPQRRRRWRALPLEARAPSRNSRSSPSPRVPGSLITQTHFDIAASGQRQLERAVVQMVKHYSAKTGLSRVCLAGGVALNCLMNQKVREILRNHAQPSMPSGS
ncbi:MAG: carbamoyltransferase N-terminal domain-containing protein [Planctomycetota bacterium]